MTVWDVGMQALFWIVVGLLFFPAGRSVLKGVALVTLVAIGLRSKRSWDA